MPSVLPQSDALLAHALDAGANECELIHVDRCATTIRITDSAIAEQKQITQSSYGIRLVKEQRIASASTSDPSQIYDMIIDCIGNASRLASRDFWRGLASATKTDACRMQGFYDKKLANITCRQAADMAQGMLNAAAHKKIDSISGSLNIVCETFEICTTNDLCKSEASTYVTGFVNAESDPNNAPMSSVSGMGHFSARTLAGSKPEQAGESAKNMCLRSIAPVSVGSGKYTVVFEPYSVGELLSFVISPNFGLKQVSEGRSCFSRSIDDKKTVASEMISIYDDPHAPEAVGSHHMDAEGMPTCKRPLIQDGMFENTYSDLYNYYKFTDQINDDSKPEPSANAARPAMPMGRSAEPIPVSAPHNMSIVPDQNVVFSADEMVSEIKNGLIVGRLWYTYAVNPIKGDFSCTARSGIAHIKDGQVISSAKPVRIMHNLLSLLNDISCVGDDAKCVVQWASLPSIAPSICVENVPVLRI